MKNTLLAAAVAAALATTAPQSPAADSPADQLANVTTAMNSIPGVIFYKDIDGVYRGGNTAWAALVGRPFAELVGKTDADLFPAELATAYRADDQKTIDGGKPRQFKEWLVYPDGRKVYSNTLKAPWIGKDGKVLGVVGICYEIDAPAGEKPAQDQ
jgi:two-component system sensor histidine kinase/response regulator